MEDDKQDMFRGLIEACEEQGLDHLVFTDLDNTTVIGLCIGEQEFVEFINTSIESISEPETIQ